MNTYPEMNGKIVELLRMRSDPTSLYAAARIEELEQSLNDTVRKAAAAKESNQPTNEPGLRLKWEPEGGYYFAPFLSVNPENEWECSVSDMPVTWGHSANREDAMLAAERALFSTYDDMTAAIAAAKDGAE